uniref:NADH-ubiquinone oxidoreductase chain 4 n=1 Tax=Amblyomma gervaisi TaxID=1987576 RepID=A0A977TQ20_9ACAR|nr:NADH dehydrogenase subunit 4 [Amblyomma gervaisi]UXX50155.1 NADH dehydrogenase subunit 4 [Amblyomma gervaisi]
MMMLIISSLTIMCLFFFFNFFEIMLAFLMLLLFFFLKTMNLQKMLVMEQFNCDLMSCLMLLLTIWIIFLMIKTSAFKIVMHNNFMFYIVLMTLLLILCFSVVNLLAFYFFFESVLFPIIMLIFGWGNQPERLQAGFYMLMYTIVGSFPMFLMIILYLKNMYSLNYIYMEWMKSFLGNFFIFLMLGFFVKIPMFLFHLWLPKAHVEAPVSGSMILAGVLLKLGIYGIFRFKMMMINEIIMYSEFIIVVSIWGSMMVSIFCLYQIDIKSLIAYSSVCHMGLVLAGTVSMSMYASYGALLLMIGHGLCSSGLFCLANIVYERIYSRGMILLKGLKSIFPSMILWWFLFSIVNMSAPLTMNMMGEFFLVLSILKNSVFFFFPIIMTIFLSACYSIYMFSYINHGQGWTIWINNMINMREYNLLFLHFFPMAFWFLKTSLFVQWI